MCQDWEDSHHAECSGVQQTLEQDETEEAPPPEQSCWEKRIGRWRGGVAEEEAREAFIGLAGTMRLWLEGLSTLEQPVRHKEQEDQQQTNCDNVVVELEEIFHTPLSVFHIPEWHAVTSLPQFGIDKDRHAVTGAGIGSDTRSILPVGTGAGSDASLPQPTATLSVAPADDEATDKAADRKHAAEMQEFQRVLENSDSTGSDLNDAAQAAHDLAYTLRADGDLEEAAEVEELALQLDDAAKLRTPIRWPDQDGTLLSW